MSEAVEHFFVEAFIPQLPIEAFDEAILLRFAGRDIVPGDAGFILPFEDGATGQFAAIVRDNGFGPAIEPDAPIEFPQDFAGTPYADLPDHPEIVHQLSTSRRP